MNLYDRIETSLFSLLMVFVLSRPAVAQQQYVITDLGKLGGGTSLPMGDVTSLAVGVSGDGYVGGWSKTNQTGPNGSAIRKPFIWYRGIMSELPSLAAGKSAIAASFAKLPNQGNFFQTYYMTGDAENAAGATRAYRFRAGFGWSMTDLGTLPDSTESHGLGVNSLGQVVGWVKTTTGSTKAFFSPGIGMSDISNGSRSVAYGINDAGQVVGYFQTGGVLHAFIYDRSTGQTTDLGSAPGYPHSYAFGINQSGQVVGYVSTLFQPGSFRGFLYSNGAFQLIGNVNNVARALNSSGQVVGSFKDANGKDRAYIFQNNQMTDLNTLIPSTSGWVLRVAQAINDVGQIVGYGTIGGETHAFMMTPIPSTYNVTEIPLIYDPANPNANWIRINNRGQVVGESAQGHAAVWEMSNNVLTELTNVPSHANDINDWGEIVGSTGRAFYYVNGSMTDLGTLGGAGSVARGINYAAQIVGTAPAAVRDRAFITTPNSPSMTALPLPPGYTHSGAAAINDFSHVVGRAFYNANGMSFSSAFVWTPSGGSIPLQSPGNYSEATDINNASQAVGSSQFAGQQYSHACIWTKDSSGQWRITDLEPSSASPASIAWAINNLGQIVGYSSNSGGAFLWRNGAMIDLNSKLPPNSGILLLYALDINDYGQIVCVGRVLGQQQQRVYLLTR